MLKITTIKTIKRIKVSSDTKNRNEIIQEIKKQYTVFEVVYAGSNWIVIDIEEKGEPQNEKNQIFRTTCNSKKNKDQILKTRK